MLNVAFQFPLYVEKNSDEQCSVITSWYSVLSLLSLLPIDFNLKSFFHQLVLFGAPSICKLAIKAR